MTTSNAAAPSRQPLSLTCCQGCCTVQPSGTAQRISCGDAGIYLSWLHARTAFEIDMRAACAAQSALGADQLSWLLNDLARVDRSVTPWVTVSWHQPPVSFPNQPLSGFRIAAYGAIASVSAHGDL